MNELSHQPRSTTQTADGIPRLRWTLAEFERLTELGIFGENDRIELLGGELIPMSPKGRQHEGVRSAILNWLRQELPAEFDLHTEPGWRPNEVDYVEPDFLISRKGGHPASVQPQDVVLIIEVAHSSLKLDTTVKAATYARHGVQEYWVVDALNLTTRVHRRPSASGYGDVTEVPAKMPLGMPLMPGVALTLGDLPLP
ncbi:MAG: Uma2 family endonuclease [Hyphomicrobiales bacterium]|nr:MAG: Uma2 family endonuclease [Hyphomicrobiales bacterium]